MFKKILSTIAVAVMASSAADYMFPTAYPSGVDMDTVKQIVTFIWDDNAYSGLAQTNYETKPGQEFKDHSWVGGKKPWGAAAKNELNLEAGDFGVSWAITKLAGRTMPLPSWKPDGTYTQGMEVEHNGFIWTPKYWTQSEPTDGADSPWTKVGPVVDSMSKKNPDNSPISFTFNVTTGQFVPIFGPEDGQRESKYGYWEVNEKDVQEFPHLSAYYGNGKKIAVCWGREQMVKRNESDEGNVNGEAYGMINEAFKMTRKFGHEVGNHTVDHMETNSGLPNDERGFGRWGGEGFAANQVEEASWGDTTFMVDEAEEFGRIPGISWHSMGWKSYAGRMLSQNGWKGIVELGEVELEEALGMKRGKEQGDIKAFRAPRLEVSSGLFYALSELGYLYDCGLEEGYEYYIDGTNFLWPYTTDNGSPNVTWQRGVGEHVAIDSMPAGLWEIPAGVMVVPEDIREDVWKNHAKIARAEFAEGKGPEPTAEDSTHWVNSSGKITGFDFNLFILWGMTNENARKTLRYNLDQRMKGGKAPMQFGAHTETFTPIYDLATLQDDFNVNTYGLCVTEGWNDWKSRQAILEEFIDYGVGQGAYFWSGDRTIEYVRKIANSDKVGTEHSFEKTWDFYKNDKLNSSSNKENCTGSIEATVKVAKKDGENEPNAGYATYFEAGTLDSLDHISLTYKTTTPLAVKLIMKDDRPWEVLLSSVGNSVESGTIPLTAFHYNQYDIGEKKFPNTADIIGVEIQLLTSGLKEKEHSLSISDFKIYSGKSKVAIAGEEKKAVGKVGVTSLTNNALTLNLTTQGKYDIAIHSLDGRMIQSVNSKALVAGTNKISLQNMASGVYLVTIKSGSFQTALKSVIK